ncbi:hypothetical protein Pla110_31150 [Polystyrenella longa]|uniref:Uncharacterized protein n=1 Tax=Polystyrenella longa TaxID=2528007 RepID=A0A518CQ97_9PLAN|nr:hypothetical protein Pla110_31150 [Polystyrenella longa]
MVFSFVSAIPSTQLQSLISQFTGESDTRLPVTGIMKSRAAGGEQQVKLQIRFQSLSLSPALTFLRGSLIRQIHLNPALINGPEDAGDIQSMSFL